MQAIRQLFRDLRRMHPYSKRAVKFTLALAATYYILALLFRLFAPQMESYFYAMALFRGCLEAAPAILAAGLCGALIGDLMLSRSGRQDDD